MEKIDSNKRYSGKDLRGRLDFLLVLAGSNTGLLHSWEPERLALLNSVEPTSVALVRRVKLKLAKGVFDAARQPMGL